MDHLRNRQFTDRLGESGRVHENIAGTEEDMGRQRRYACVVCAVYARVVCAVYTYVVCVCVLCVYVCVMCG